MVLGQMLLSIKGEEDKYFTGNPQYTFFKSVYRRHTNFALDNAFIPFTGDTRNVFGRTISITIPKSGDLLYYTNGSHEVCCILFD